MGNLCDSPNYGPGFRRLQIRSDTRQLKSQVSLIAPRPRPKLGRLGELRNVTITSCPASTTADNDAFLLGTRRVSIRNSEAEVQQLDDHPANARRGGNTDRVPRCDCMTVEQLGRRGLVTSNRSRGMANEHDDCNRHVSSSESRWLFHQKTSGVVMLDFAVLHSDIAIIPPTMLSRTFAP